MDMISDHWSPGAPGGNICHRYCVEITIFGWYALNLYQYKSRAMKIATGQWKHIRPIIEHEPIKHTGAARLPRYNWWPVLPRAIEMARVNPIKTRLTYNKKRSAIHENCNATPGKHRKTPTTTATQKAEKQKNEKNKINKNDNVNDWARAPSHSILFWNLNKTEKK